MSVSMRVAVDATAIPADLGGVGRYVVEVAAALSRLGVDVALVVDPHGADATALAAPGVEVVPAPAAVASAARRLVWEQTGLPGLVQRLSAPVLLSPHYTMPWRVDAARVVTLHDATFFSDPGVHSPVKRRFFRLATRRAVTAADALVVPSAATRDEVVRYAGGRPDRFHVAHHGVDTARFHPTDAAEQDRVRRSLGLEGRTYVAFLGTLEPRKNVPALIAGWQRAVQDLPDPPALVLAGGPGWDQGVDPAIAAVPAGLSVLRPGYLPLDDLAGYLSGASVVAYPSLGEGFGLPVLEAMACGAPVLTTRALSLPEVGGDAVAYCDPSPESIGTALGQLLGSAHERDTLAGRAVQRAATFTWEASARAHVAAFEDALRRRG
jgi:glycosyltransferase involved in cell wall biosynthesis